jgi:hypothetical protein
MSCKSSHWINNGMSLFTGDESSIAFKCREKMKELAKQKLYVDERICGLCFSVCPIGTS